MVSDVKSKIDIFAERKRKAEINKPKPAKKSETILKMAISLFVYLL